MNAAFNMSVLIGVAMLAMTMGCDRKPAQLESAAPDLEQAAVETEAQATPEPLGPTAEGESYKISTIADERYTPGPGKFGVNLNARGKWHVNQDYPIELSLNGKLPQNGRALELKKKTYTKADVAEIGEDAVRYEVAFSTPKPGPYDVEAELSFAMCTPKTCVQETRKVAVALKVEQ